MYYIGLDVHKKTISYLVKDAAGCVYGEGKIGSARREVEVWVKTLPQPRMMAMEATMFTGWISDNGQWDELAAKCQPPSFSSLSPLPRAVAMTLLQDRL